MAKSSNKEISITVKYSSFWNGNSEYFKDGDMITYIYDTNTRPWWKLIRILVNGKEFDIAVIRKEEENNKLSKLSWRVEMIDFSKKL